MCHRGPSIVASKPDSRSTANIRVDCGSWECFECRSKMQRQHIANCRSILGKLDFTYTITVPVEEWRAVFMRLFRVNAKYMRFTSGCGTVLVFADRPFTGGEKYDIDKAIESMQLAIQLMEKPLDCERYRPISYCRSWQIKHEATGWKRICYAVADSFRKCCRALNLNTMERTLAGTLMIFAATNVTTVEFLRDQLERDRYAATSVMGSSRNSYGPDTEVTTTDDTDASDGYYNGPSPAEEALLRPDSDFI